MKKKYELKTDWNYKMISGGGSYDFNTGQGKYSGKNGYVVIYGTQILKDGSRDIGFQFNKDGRWYYRCYKIQEGFTEKGILLLAKKFQDEIFGKSNIQKIVDENNKANQK